MIPVERYILISLIKMVSDLICAFITLNSLTAIDAYERQLLMSLW